MYEEIDQRYHHYKICTKYNKSTGVFKCFINGALSEYTGYYNTTPVDLLTIGKHAWRTDRYGKATFKTVAVWDKELTDEECLALSIWWDCFRKRVNSLEMLTQQDTF